MKRTVILLLIVTACLLLSSGCATVMQGKHQAVIVSSSPQGATVTANGQQSVITPGKLTLRRGDPHTLVCTKQGYYTETQILKPRLGGWAFGNILLGGIPGIIVDSASGATAVYDKSCHFTLRLKEIK